MFVMDSASLRIVPEQTCGDNHFREMVDGIWEKVGMWTELVSFFVFHFTSPLLLVLSLSFTSMFPSPIFVQCLECWFHHWFCFVSPSFSAEDPGVHGLISLRYCLRTGAGRSDHQNGAAGGGGGRYWSHLFFVFAACQRRVKYVHYASPECPGGWPQLLIKFELSRAGADIERLLESWPRPSFNNGESRWH